MLEASCNKEASFMGAFYIYLVHDLPGDRFQPSTFNLQPFAIRSPAVPGEYS